MLAQLLPIQKPNYLRRGYQRIGCVGAGADCGVAQTAETGRNISYLFITHDLTLAASMCDRIAVMYQGRIVETGRTLEIIRSPAHPYTQMLLSCVLPAKVDPDFVIADWEALREPAEQGCAFYPDCPKASAQCGEKSRSSKIRMGGRWPVFLKMTIVFLLRFWLLSAHTEVGRELQIRNNIHLRLLGIEKAHRENSSVCFFICCI